VHVLCICLHVVSCHGDLQRWAGGGSSGKGWPPGGQLAGVGMSAWLTAANNASWRWRKRSLAAVCNIGGWRLAYQRASCESFISLGAISWHRMRRGGGRSAARKHRDDNAGIFCMPAAAHYPALSPAENYLVLSAGVSVRPKCNRPMKKYRQRLMTEGKGVSLWRGITAEGKAGITALVMAHT